jgi:sec-independent protein translocase protein TatA
LSRRERLPRKEIDMLAEIFGLDGVVVLIIVVVVLFGGAAIPKLARSLGSAQGEFKKGVAEGHAGDSHAADSKGAAPTVTPTAPIAAPTDEQRPSS